MRKTLAGLLVGLILGGATVALGQGGSNKITITQTPSGTAPRIVASGLDSSISINAVPKANGCLQVNGVCVATLIPAAIAAGAVVYGTGNNISGNSTNFYWDDVNIGLRIGSAGS